MPSRWAATVRRPALAMARKDCIESQSNVVGICDSLQRNRQFIRNYVRRTPCESHLEKPTNARIRPPSGSSLTMRSLDRGTIDLAFVVLRQLRDKHDVLRLLVACDLPGHEFDDLVGTAGCAGALRAHGLDRFAPLRIRNADHHDFHDVG